MNLRKGLLAAIPAAALICGAAVAADDPSADQIIQSLTPSGSDLTGPTRGIRAVNVPGTQATVTPAGTEASGGGGSIDLSIQFASGSASLTPHAMVQLDALGKALTSSQLSADKFRIEGHTDTVGSADTNKTLSTARANAVASYLESKYGITADRLQPVGMGEEGLLVQTPDQTPEPQNRRVHIVNLGA